MKLESLVVDMGYINDIRLEHKFAKTLKAIIGIHFVSQDFEADVQDATDFLVFNLKPIKVAVRLRTFNFYLKEKYRQEFTIRWSRPSGVPTEIHKIREGRVDYFIYGFVNKSESEILQWRLFDFNIFRNYEPKPLIILPNNPPDSEFAVYGIAQFPEQLIKHEYGTNALLLLGNLNSKSMRRSSGNKLRNDLQKE